MEHFYFTFWVKDHFIFKRSSRSFKSRQFSLQSLFKYYSLRACQYECKFHSAVEQTNCIPWDYIRPNYLINMPVCTRNLVSLVCFLGPTLFWSRPREHRWLDLQTSLLVHKHCALMRESRRVCQTVFWGPNRVHFRKFTQYVYT